MLISKSISGRGLWVAGEVWVVSVISFKAQKGNPIIACLASGYQSSRRFEDEKVEKSVLARRENAPGRDSVGSAEITLMLK
nr:hypothetical protein [uncultured Pseudomonas sp.]